MLTVAIGIVLGSTTARILLGGPRGPGSKAWIKRCDYHKSRGDPVALSSHQVATSSPSAPSTTKVLATLQRDGGHATTCTPAGAPRVQLRRPEESAPKSCRAATHGKPLSSVGPQRSRFLTLFHHSDRRRQERLHGLDRPSAGAGRPRASMPGTVRRVVPFSSEADRSNGGTLASPLSRPCRARRP